MNLGVTRIRITAPAPDHDQISGIGSDDHHAIQHAIGSGLVHTGVVTNTQHGVRTLANAHAHSAMSGQGVDDHHDEAHTALSHSDQGATGAELETLTDGSNADSLHAHVVVITLEFFVPITARGGVFPNDTGVGDFVTSPIGAAQTVNINFFVPADFSSLVSAVVVVIADNTETTQYDVVTDFGAAGEVHTANSDSLVNSTQAITVNEIEELDVSGALTGLAAGDYVGLVFNSDINILRPIGLRIKYS